MASSEDLSYAFLEHHPTDAARVIERLAPASAAALLQSAPLRLAAPVLRQMLPLAGARCLERLADVDAAGLLRSVGAQAGVALLRNLDAARRASLLAQLPSALTLAYELLLGYPEDSIGAWMDPRPPAFPADMSIGEVLERVRTADEAFANDPFVIDRNQRLLGYVSFAELLRGEAAAPLSRLQRPCPHRLPAQAPLRGLPEHPAWHEAAALAVVGADNRLVGSLTHAALLRALSLAPAKPAPADVDETLAGLASAYWFGVDALIQALISLLPVKSGEGKS